MKPEDKKFAETTLATINDEIALFEGWEIETEEERDQVGEYLADVKTRHKALEARRKEITGPLLEAKRSVDALFKPPRLRLEAAEALLKDKLVAYVQAQEKRNAAALEATQAASTPQAAVEALADVRPAAMPEGVSVRYRWKPEVIDPLLLDRRFLSPDLDKIERWMEDHCKEDGTPLAIPGVRFDKRPIVTARGKK